MHAVKYSLFGACTTIGIIMLVIFIPSLHILVVLIHRRQTMRRKDAHKLINDLSKKYGSIEASMVEIAEFEEKKIFILNSKIEFIEDENGLFPFLGGSYLEILPRVVVDMGAIRFVCNGADIMAPGITKLDEFTKGAVVVIRDITHGKGLAIGISKKNSSEIELKGKGKVIKNIHYVGDKLWEAALA